MTFFDSPRKVEVVGRPFPVNSLLLAMPLIIAAALATAQQPGDQQLGIAQIEIEGLQRLSPEEILTTTGLKIGQAFDIVKVNAAAQRLVNSGVLKKVGFRTRTKGNQVIIVFEVEEAKGGDSLV